MVYIVELKSAVGQIHHGDKYVLAVEQNKVLIPPSYNKYLAWGYSDLSVRIGNYESEKVNRFLNSDSLVCANSVDLDQTAPEEQFDLSLHCLPFLSQQISHILYHLVTTST